MKKKILIAFIFSYVFTACASLAHAQLSNTDYTKAGVSDQIKQFLCAPSDPDPKQTNYNASGIIAGTDASRAIQYSGANNKASSDLYNCINRLYRFAIVLSAVVGVFFIVIAGYLYMSSEGNQESADKAKSILASTITALVILFIGFILLKAINPDLIQFRSIQPPSVTVSKVPAPLEGGTDTSAAPQVLSTNAQQLAAQIKNLHPSQITLASSHPSGKGSADGANALANITDVAAGNLAKRSAYEDGGLTGPGGQTALNTSMLQALISLQSKFGKIAISEIAGGVHGQNSDHYTGKAFDVTAIGGQAVNSSNNQYRALMDECKKLGARVVLGPGDSGHSTHVHCGW